MTQRRASRAIAPLAHGRCFRISSTRQDFTKSLIDTLQSGTGDLILADTNEEGANVLALQARQDLSQRAGDPQAVPLTAGEGRPHGNVRPRSRLLG